MTSRWTLAAIAAAVTLTAACSSSDDAASPETSVVTVTTVVSAPSSTTVSTDAAAASDPTTDDETATPEPASTTSTVDRGTGASAYVGHYQRHESGLDLAADQTGSILEGSGALDGETWAVTWQPAATGITITYERLTNRTGKGLYEPRLAPGQTLSAHFGTGETGNRVLVVAGVSPARAAYTWCLPRLSSPECGA